MNKNNKWFLASLLFVAIATNAGCASTAATSGGTKTAVQAEASKEETGYEDYVTVYDPQAGKKCKSPVSRGVREALAVGILGVYNPALAVESAAKWWVLD